MTTKYNKQAVKDYILNAINADGNDIVPPLETDKEKLIFLDQTFRSEYGYLIPRVGYQNAMKEWISGLPSSFNIEYRNSEILELAYQWGSLEEGATERQEEKIIENFFHFIAAKTTMMINKALK